MTGSAAPGGVPADSFSVAWRGRTLTAQPFADDDGRADPALVAALTDHAVGRGTESGVLAALAGARVLVPVVAAVGEGHPLPDHVRGDAGAEMSLPLLGGPDGIRAMPVFTGTETLTAWDASARPVPVKAARAALSAVEEGCSALLVDPGSDHAFVVRRPPLWALAQGRTWVAPHADDELAAAVAAALRPVTDVVPARAVTLAPGRQAELAVVLSLEGGLDERALRDVLQRTGELLAGLPLLTERAGSLELRPVPVSSAD